MNTSHYTLTLCNPITGQGLNEKVESAIIAELREMDQTAALAFGPDGICDNDVSWNRYEKTMAEISRRHPFVLFEMECVGFSFTGFRTDYFLDSKCQSVEGSVEYPPFDITKLK